MASMGKDLAERLACTGSVLAMAVAALAAVLASGPASAASAQATVRPGAYGRIDVSRSAPPPVIHVQPVRVEPPPVGAAAQVPVYLYVPPGQVRKWPQHCAKWKACDVPVYFVRVDNSPSKLGKWKETARPAPPVSLVQAFAPRAN